MFHVAGNRELEETMSKLSETDRRAVDAILMNGPYNTTMPAVNPDNASIKQVANLLRLLDLMPVIEPPADLAARTLARIRATGGSIAPKTDQDRPAMGDSNLA
jgi:hypothetical protein